MCISESRGIKTPCPGSIIAAVTSYGRFETTAFRPRTSPESEILVMIVLPSRDDVDSFTLPVHRTKTPRGCCPSMNSIAPLGYTAVDLISLSRCPACGERLQNKCSLRTGHVRQLSRMVRP